MAVSVDIFIKDTELPPQPMAGVTVNVYNSSTFALVASGISNGAGQASFLLPGSALGTSYEVRFFKNGVLFENPKAISVLEPVVPPSTNRFDTSGTLTALPVATDPRLCRCTGQFVNFSGTPVRNTLVRITSMLGVGSITKPPDLAIPPPYMDPVPPPAPPNLLSGFQMPKILDGKMVSVGTMEFRTDNNGKVSFDLIRNGQYYASYAGEEDVVWCLLVPDRSSANLIELIHPQPVELTWNSSDAPGASISVPVGTTKSVRFQALFSNYRYYASNLGNILQFTNSDGNLADVVYNSGLGQLDITGRTVGTLQTTVSVLPNMTPPRLPDYSITAVPLSVVVTP